MIDRRRCTWLVVLPVFGCSLPECDHCSGLGQFTNFVRGTKVLEGFRRACALIGAARAGLTSSGRRRSC